VIVSGYPKARGVTPRRCWYCGDELQSGTATVDHVIPKSRGGCGLQGNTVYACRRCNATKDDMLLEEFREWVAHGADEALTTALKHLEEARRLLDPDVARAVAVNISKATAELHGVPVVFYGERSARRR
jgi:hypothetical protein